jgi:hypothetical protein
MKMKRRRAAAALVGATAALTLMGVVPAHADTQQHEVCSTQFGVGVSANWPLELTVRSNGTIATVTPGTPYLSGLVPPGMGFVSGSGWTHWTLTNDSHGITVNSGGEISFVWVTSSITCQGFWSF